jgi:hypothetical protein
LLAHGAGVFTLLTIGLFCLTGRLRPGRRAAFGGLSVAVALLVPWLAYQKGFDPPGDRLLRWHLAGAADPHDQHTLRESLADGYGHMTVGDFLSRRFYNLCALFRPSPRVDVHSEFGVELEPEAAASWLVRFRDIHLHHLFPMLALLNLGWLWLLPNLFRREDAEAAIQRLLLGLVLVSTLLWVLVLYSAGTTWLHHESYADVLLLMTLLAAALCRRGGLVYPVLALHTAVFVAAWLLTTPTLGPGTRNDTMVAVAVVCFLLLAGVALDAWDLRLRRWLRSVPAHQPDAPPPPQGERAKGRGDPAPTTGL